MWNQSTKVAPIVLNVSSKMKLECFFADADFTIGFKEGDSEDPRSARSRTKLVITHGGTLVVWERRLQTETALFTMEAEYSLRFLIPLPCPLSSFVVFYSFYWTLQKRRLIYGI
jgi:hypothetical protein